MTPQYIFKKTNQLSIAEKEQHLELFSRVFAKKMSKEQFDRKYLYTPTVYSYHGLMNIDGLIVGAYNAIPYLYMYFGQKLMFSLSVDMMIDKQHRPGPFNLHKMANLVYDAMKKDGIAFLLGFPNDQAYDLNKKVLGYRDIGELDYYVLPLNIGAVIPKLKCLDFLSRSFARILMGVPRCRHKTQHEYCIEKAGGQAFDQHRYDSGYSMVDLGRRGRCVYNIYVEDQSIRTLYMIDVYPLTSTFFDKAVEQVYAESGRLVDMILYVGTLPFRPARLVRLHDSRKPRRIRMCGKILNGEIVDDRIFQLENWNANISNFDVR